MEDWAMPAAVKLREDYSADDLRLLAKRSKDANQSRRLLSLAAVPDGMDRGEAAKIGGMDRQTLRDWAHRFNEKGPDGLFDNWTDGPERRLSPSQLQELAGIVESGPDLKTDGVVRWRRVDLRSVISARFGVDYHERYVGAHAVLIFDRAGWHTTPNLAIPANITPILLPSRAPELNPVENIWQYLRANWLSNPVFENYDAIIDAACQAWRL
jgi:transposase